MARTVEDLRMAMEVLAAPEERETLDLVPPVPWPDPENISVGDLRLGMFVDNGYFPVSPALRRAVKEVAKTLQARGAHVEEFVMPDPEGAVRIYLAAVSADGGVGFKKLLGKSTPHPLIMGLIRGAGVPRLLKPIIFKMMEMRGQVYMSSMVSAMGAISAGVYWDVVDARTAYRNRFIDAMDQGNLDAIICPPFATVAPLHGKSSELTLPAATYVMPINLLGTPAGVVPVTRVMEGEESDRKPSKDLGDIAAIETEQGSAGMPVGVQVVGRHWREDVVLAVMAAIEEDFKDTPSYPNRPRLPD
jgi:fatty acid amide hydrolase